MTILELKEVSKRVKGRKIIDDISFQLKKGEICGFVGPNGAGKTTLIRILTGLIKVNNGQVKINKEDVFENRKLALEHVGAIVENPIFFPYMSGRKNLINLGRLTPSVPKNSLDKEVENVLKEVELDKRADDKVSTYSLGMKQRLGIAQALLGKPSLIILDEPSNGLDPMGIKLFRDIILRLNREKKITFFISSHSLRELETFCSSWLFINEGKLKWKGSTEELKRNSEDIEDVFFRMMES